jgi:malonyl-CoA/methylmalonyl-CoA synthetase
MPSWIDDIDPAVTNLPALIRARMMDPAKHCLRNADGRDFSYAALWALSGQIATALVASGVTKGDRVAVQADKSPEFIALFLACGRCGAAFLPLNTAYTAAEVDYFLGDAEPRVFVVMPDRMTALGDLATRKGVSVVHSLGTRGDGTLMEASAGADPEFVGPALGWNDLVAILYTSGTTGRSKGAMLSHGNLASNALSLVKTWRFTAADTLLHALPVYHTHGLFTATNTVLLSGGTMLFRPKFDPDEALRLLPSVTTMMGVPTFYTRLLQHPGLTREATAHMRLFVSGSAPLLAETHAAFRERTGHAILERYGMTETNMNTSNPYDGERIAGTVGLPLPGVSVRITNPETGAVLPTGEIGMIEVRGPNVFAGYWRMPEKTAQEFRADGYFITGDLGHIGPNLYVSIVGRGKDLIITGGLNVYPKEVESEIDSIPGVVETAVIGVPHADFGEAVVAVIVAGPAADLDEAAVLRHIETRLARFKLPKAVRFVPELPRNAMGKVQKNVLRETYGGLFASGPA